MNSPSPAATRHSARSQDGVCIVGDGVIAKTAALGFAQAGIDVTLLCPVRPAGGANAPDVNWDQRVYALNHTAHQLLSSLKVWGALDAARVAPVDAMQVAGDAAPAGALALPALPGSLPAGLLSGAASLFDNATAAFAKATAPLARAGGLHFDAFGAHTGALAWIVEERNIAQALDAALRFAHNVHVVHGTAIKLETGGERALVHLQDGAPIACSLVLGADGAQSWVRGQCDIGIDYRPYGQRGVVGNFTCAKPHGNVARQWFLGGDGIVALLPLPGQRVSLVWSAPDALADTLLAEGSGAVAKRLQVFCLESLGELAPLPPEQLRAFPLRLIRPHALTAPRVALAGDAAHVVHPLAGHGMNLGFADVADLLAVVAAREPQRGIGDARVLERYARARREDVLLMQVTTDALARLFGSDIEPLRMARNLGLNLLDRLPLLKRRLIAHAMGKQDLLES